MYRLRRNLPSLDALIFLEAAGRHQSFTRAAGELGVSQAAVSKRVRQLEDWMGVSLIERVGRGVRMTAEGERLVTRIRLGFDFIEETITGMRAPNRPPVRLACMTALAMFWLQPRLRDFALGDEASDVSLTLTDTPSELLSGAHDLVLIYGDGHHPGWSASRILTEALQPVCAPDLPGAGPRDLEALRGKSRLLDFPRRGPDWIDWAGWSSLPDAAEISNWPSMMCETYPNSIGLALRGRGVALGSFPLLADEVASGRLLPLTPGPVTTPRGYWLLHRSGAELSAPVAGLKTFLLDAAQRA